MVEYIYYSGVGAKKSGKHTVNEFLKIMNKNYNIQCSEFLPELDYKPCNEYLNFMRKALEYNITNNKPMIQKSKKNEKKYKKLLDKCNKYRKTAKKRNCNLEEYIKFSGAEKKN